MIKRTKVFLNEVQSEMKKVSWPTRQELIESATVVVISVGILTLFIGIVDFILSRLVALLLR